MTESLGSSGLRIRVSDADGLPSAVLGAPFFDGLRCADRRDILSSPVGAGLSCTERNVSLAGPWAGTHDPAKLTSSRGLFPGEIHRLYRASARSTTARSKLWVRRISRYPSLSPMHSLWSA
jgi:hypothetical protein